MKVNQNIFRQYDIRGVVGEELTEEAVYAVGRAFASTVIKSGRTKVIIGMDNRKSSPRFSELIREAVLSSGLDVVDIGTVVTPMFYFAAKHLDIDAGIMITASHNPKEFNGFKILLGPSTIYGDDIQKIRELIEKEEFTSLERNGEYKKVDISDDYINMIKDKVKLGKRKLKVVIDCGNGTASFFAPRLFRELGCEVLELYCQSDTDFPNHFPDPVKPNNLKDLIALVQKERADLGIGFDGDADRIGVVDENGKIIWGDMLMVLFFREVLKKYPGSTCIVEVKCSQALIDEIEKLGGKPFIYKTGHSLIKAKMREIGAVFTGEMSGHMFFADEYYGYDDALYAAARLLRILSNTDMTLGELLKDVPKYYSTPEIRVKTTDEEKFKIVEKVLSHFKPRYNVIDVDGARVLFPDGWGLVRASNTGPELIIRCESKTEEGLERIKREIEDSVKPLKVNWE